MRAWMADAYALRVFGAKLIILSTTFFAFSAFAGFPFIDKIYSCIEHLEKQKQERKFRRSSKKILKLIFDSNREKFFVRNYLSAMAILRRQNVEFGWTSEGIIRGLLFPASSKSQLNRQAKLIADLTGYNLIYSPDQAWSMKIIPLMTGYGINASIEDIVYATTPIALTDRERRIVFGAPDMVLAGHLTHFERHEVNHAYLNNLEDQGVDTGALLPKLTANGAVTTQTKDYATSIDLQEMYAFANQIQDLGSTILKLNAKSREAEKQVLVLEAIMEGYLPILSGINDYSRFVVENLNRGNSKIISEFESVGKAYVRLVVKHGLSFIFKPSDLELKAIRNGDLSSLILRFRKIQRISALIYNEINHFLDSETSAPFDNNNQWTPGYRALIDFPLQTLYKENDRLQLELNKRFPQTNFRLISEGLKAFNSQLN